MEGESELKLTKNLFYQMVFQCPHAPPEIGGLLGSQKDDEFIDRWYLDNRHQTVERAAYIPDVLRINEVLVDWLREGITFRGIFHSHPETSIGLSGSDRSYIKAIMLAMPKGINKLYFPVIYPGKSMDAFLAVKKENSMVTITKTQIQIYERGTDYEERK